MSHQIHINYADVKNRVEQGVKFVGLRATDPQEGEDKDCALILNMVSNLYLEDDITGVFELYFKFGYNLINIKDNFPTVAVYGYEDNALYPDYGHALFGLLSKVPVVMVSDPQPLSFISVPDGYNVLLVDRSVPYGDAVEFGKNCGFKYLIFNNGEECSTTNLVTQKDRDIKKKKMVPEVVKTPDFLPGKISLNNEEGLTFEYVEDEPKKDPFWRTKKNVKT